jgi:hypothetical protein
MKKELKKGDGIECIFTDKEGKEVSCFIPESKIRELIEDEAYERVTRPECDCSTCAVNNFCECDPINEGVELSELIMCVIM